MLKIPAFFNCVENYKITIFQRCLTYNPRKKDFQLTPRFLSSEIYIKDRTNLIPPEIKDTQNLLSFIYQNDDDLNLNLEAKGGDNL